MLKKAIGQSTDVLVITEGLLLYLGEAQVRSLAMDLGAQAGIRWWILDLASPVLLEMMKKSMGAPIGQRSDAIRAGQWRRFFRGFGLAREAYSIGVARRRAIATLAVDFEVVRILA